MTMMVIMMVKSDRNRCDYDDVMVVLTNDAGNNKKIMILTPRMTMRDINSNNGDNNKSLHLV